MTISEVCAVSVFLCSFSDGHYTKSGNYSISDEEKGRRALATHVSHLRERRHDLTKRISLLPNSKKANRIFSTRCSLGQPAMVPVATHTRTYVLQWACSGGPTQEAQSGAQPV
jgi:hypothetical protein